METYLEYVEGVDLGSWKVVFCEAMNAVLRFSQAGKPVGGKCRVLTPHGLSPKYVQRIDLRIV